MDEKNISDRNIENTDLIKPINLFCDFCKYKKRITQLVKCKCDKKFCFDCRMPEKHNCSFDYKGKFKEVLGKKLEIVKKDKLNRID